MSLRHFPVRALQAAHVQPHVARVQCAQYATFSQWPLPETESFTGPAKPGELHSRPQAKRDLPKLGVGFLGKTIVKRSQLRVLLCWDVEKLSGVHWRYGAGCIGLGWVYPIFHKPREALKFRCAASAHQAAGWLRSTPS
jgi:hypothetical protein